MVTAIPKRSPGKAGNESREAEASASKRQRRRWECSRKMTTPGLVKEDAQHARIILRYTEKEKLAENVKNVCSRILDMKEIGAARKIQSESA